MRIKIGSLVNFAYCDYLGIVIESNGQVWIVHFTNGDKELCWDEELEVLCK